MDSDSKARTRFRLVYKAKVAEQADLYPEMKDAMKAVVELGDPLSEEERNLLSVAYKNVVGSRRTAWRIISSMEVKEASNEDKAAVTADVRKEIEQQLTTYCDEILELLDSKLIQKHDDLDASDAKSKCAVEGCVFFLKMKGDYFRYKVEIGHEDERQGLSDKANKAYESAYELAQTHLSATHPIRLGLALNYSVYYYEVTNDPVKACQLARKAFDEGISELEQTNSETYKDSTLIMQLLRDNLTLWTTNEDNNDDQPGDT